MRPVRRQRQTRRPRRHSNVYLWYTIVMSDALGQIEEKIEELKAIFLTDVA